jgi:predicted DNA-binding protein YlxM (UPF0122 family)
MATDLEFIQGLTALFSRISQFKSPLGATAYYTLLLKGSPTSFKTISQDARDAMGTAINTNKLRTGRQDLLEHGFIAEVLPVHDEAIDLDREAFLPISPELIWQDNIKKLGEVISPEGIEHRHDLVKELYDIYKKNFGRYGIKIEDGSITVFHSSQWLLYHLGYNIQNNESIRMLLGTLGSFKEPYIKYYENMLTSQLITRIICDPVTPEANQGINNIMKLKEKYLDHIQLKATPVSYGTSRRMIYDNMAIDGKKLLNFNSDLSYISTVYLQQDIIDRMRANFDNAFQKGLEIKRSANDSNAFEIQK